jgi:hypothetical protein
MLVLRWLCYTELCSKGSWNVYYHDYNDYYDYDYKDRDSRADRCGEFYS